METVTELTDSLGAPPPQAQGEKFFPVWLKSLRVDTIADFDIHLPPTQDRPPLLYRHRNLPFTAETQERLVERGVERLLVRADEEKEYRRYIERNLDVIVADPTIDAPVKSELLYHSATNLLDEVLQDPRAGDVIARSRSFVQGTCQFMLTERHAFEYLLRVTSFDYYTYTHSVNVFMFSLSLARRAGISDPQLLVEFGEGALLHDIGKSMIDPAIIRAPGKLTDEQWQQMRLHTVYGYDILTEQGMTSSVSLSVVRSHHEKLTGRGYPDGLPPEQIPPLTRISTIADIFDALTTRRSYKDAMGSFPALTLMRDKMSDDLDPDLFRLFVEMLGNPDTT